MIEVHFFFSRPILRSRFPKIRNVMDFADVPSRDEQMDKVLWVCYCVRNSDVRSTNVYVSREGRPTSNTDFVAIRLYIDMFSSRSSSKQQCRHHEVKDINEHSSIYSTETDAASIRRRISGDVQHSPNLDRPSTILKKKTGRKIDWKNLSRTISPKKKTCIEEIEILAPTPSLYLNSPFPLTTD